MPRAVFMIDIIDKNSLLVKPERCQVGDDEGDGVRNYHHIMPP